MKTYNIQFIHKKGPTNGWAFFISSTYDKNK